MATTTMFTTRPDGPRLGRIRGDLDRAALELTIMGESAPTPSLADTIAAALIEVKAALHALDAVLVEVNKSPHNQPFPMRPAPGAGWIPGEERS